MRKRLLAIIATAAMVVAMVPSMVFADVATALPAADANGVIKLTEHVTLSGTFTVNAGETRTIDLNGYTVSMTISDKITQNHEMILNKGNLTIMDSSSAQTGKITYNYKGEDTAIDSSGKDGVASNTITNNPGAKLVINSGTIENLTENKKTTSTSIQIAYIIDSRTNNGQGDVYLEINGGTFNGKKGTGIRAFGNSTSETNKVVINGGTFNTGIHIQDSNAGANKMDITIKDGEFTSTGDAIYLYGNGDSSEINVSIEGGTFNSSVYLTQVNTTERFNAEISGGNFKSDVWVGTWLNNNYTSVPAVTGGTFATDIGPNGENIIKGDKLVWDKDTGKVIDPNAPTEDTNKPAAPPEKSPNTGDNSMAPFAVAGLVLAAMTAVVATRRRTN